MTAQIVILNKLAVAVASDSSVTLFSGDRQRRSYPSADKIFPLPAPHLLAVLQSGDTAILGVPYVVLLGEWMRTLSEERLPRVSEYVASFSQWMEQQTDLFTDALQGQYFGWMLKDFFLAVRRDVLERCELDGLSPDEWKTPRAIEVTEGVIRRWLERLRTLERLPGYDDINADVFLAAHAELLDEAREWVFDDIPRSEEGDAMLSQIAAQLLTADEPFSRDATLVFAGFGERELFPASQEVRFRGVLAGKVRNSVNGYVAITSDDAAVISPYAQSEAVNTFLRGYNYSFLSAAHKRLDLVIEANESAKAVPSGAAELAALASTMHEDLQSDFDRLSADTFVQPLMDTIAELPAPELARMAESLVGLQVLRQLSQADSETVGGPVDVALLTRERGLSWVRHKTLGVPEPLTPWSMVRKNAL